MLDDITTATGTVSSTYIFLAKFGHSYLIVSDLTSDLTSLS